MATAPPQAATLPTAPDFNDRSTANARADAFAKALPGFGTDMQALADSAYTNAQDADSQAAMAASYAASALAASNFAGMWSTLTGAKTHGITVGYGTWPSIDIYLLTQDVADITAEVPGTSTKLQILNPKSSLRALFFR